MANVFYGQNRGQDDANPEIVAYGTSTQATDIEVRIDTGKSVSRKDVALALDNIKARILSGKNNHYPDL